MKITRPHNDMHLLIDAAVSATVALILRAVECAWTFTQIDNTQASWVRMRLNS